jgi:LuxR family maltose regulon positive regulatory protein
MTRIPPLLAGKIQIPRHAEGTLLRTRLLDALHEHIDRKLQFIIAPAGFGKTTLLVDFVHDAAFAPCWITLDSTDRDLGSFVENIIAAIGAVRPKFGRQTLRTLHGSSDLDGRAVLLAHRFVSDIEKQLDGLTVLVLDDFQQVDESGAVTRFLNEVLRLLPDALRIVIASRTIPNLMISRLIVERQVFGLGEADLRFSTGELLTLLRRRGHDITTEQAAALAHGAEGWVAGFLLSVPQLWDGLVGGLIASRGPDGPLYDYLAAEAFDRQPPDIQRFLLTTSVLETATSGPVTALCGSADWRTLLDRVEGAGLFVTRLPGEEGAFRYHQLFRTFLQDRLRRLDAAEYARLHAIAAAEMTATGAWTAALTHLREAGREHEAAALLARIAPNLERMSRWQMLSDAVADIPSEHLLAYPSLLLSGAQAALHTGNLRRAETLALSVCDVASNENDEKLKARGLVHLGYTRRLQGRTADALHIFDQALHVARGDDELQATIRRHVGKCLGVQGDFAGAAAALRQSLAYFDRVGAAYDAAQSEFGLGVALAKSGQLGEAIARYESALTRWRHLNDPIMEAELLNCLGCANGYRGEYAAAKSQLQEALALIANGGSPITQAATLHSLGEILLTMGEISAARSTFEQALAIGQECGELWITTQTYNALALTAAFLGDLRRAEEQAHHAVSLAERQESRYLQAVCSVTLAAVQVRMGKHGGLTALRTAAEALTDMHAAREAAQARVWLAHAQFRAGALDEARDTLREALRAANDLGSDSVLDLPARWDVSLIEYCCAHGVERARLGAILDRIAAPIRAASLPPPVSLPALSVSGFGLGIAVLDGAAEVAWKWDKTRELFFLLLHEGARRREQLLALLWPDLSPAKSRAALHTAVYRLRRAIHPDVIILRDGVYRLHTEMIVSYDVRSFEHLVKTAINGDEADMVSLLQQAVDLYKGHFLEDLDAEWCSVERRRLERNYLNALERLVDAYALSGETRLSIDVADRLVAADPLREDIHARIVRSYLRLGDHAAARRQLERSLALLQRDLGVPPGPDLQALCRRFGL